MADGVVEFNMSDGIPPLVMQKLNANFKALAGVSDGGVGKILTGTVLPESAPDGAFFYNTETGDISVWRNLGEYWAWTSATSSDMANLETAVQEAQELIEAMNQHFWTNDQGAHITDITQEEWVEEAASEDAFDDVSDEKPYHNLLLNSLGMLLRSALNNLVSITRSAVAFFDGDGNSSSNITAFFGSNGAQIGKSGSLRLMLSNILLSLVNDTNETVFSVEENVTGSVTKVEQLATYTNSTDVDTTEFSVSDSLIVSGTPTVVFETAGEMYTLASSYVTTAVTVGEGIAVALTSDGVSYVANLLDESGDSGTLSVSYAAAHYDKAVLNMDGSVVVNGSDNAISIVNNEWSSSNMTDTYFNASNTVTGKLIYFGVGSGGQNRGIYDRTLRRWQIYTDANGNTCVNGNNFVVVPDGSVSLKGSGATNITQRSNRVSTRLNAAAPSSNVYFDSLTSLDKNGDSVFYTQSGFTTARDLYRSFVCRRYSANGQTAYTNGFYLHIDNSGDPAVTFTSGAPAAWRDGLGLGTVATHNVSDFYGTSTSHNKNLVLASPASEAGAGTWRTLVAADLKNAVKYITSQKQYTVEASSVKTDCTAPLAVPTGYKVAGVVRISTGANWVMPYAWTWSDSTVTVSVRNFSTSEQQDKTLTVGCICIPENS